MARPCAIGGAYLEQRQSWCSGNPDWTRGGADSRALLYVNAQCLSTNMSRRATGRTTFRSPGSTWLDDGYFSVFGNEQSDLSAPYETFNIVQMHVPRGGALGDGVYEVGRRLLRRMRTATTPEITRAFRPPM